MKEITISLQEDDYKSLQDMREREGMNGVSMKLYIEAILTDTAREHERERGKERLQEYLATRQ